MISNETDDLKDGIEKQKFMGANGFVIRKDNKSDGEIKTTDCGSNTSLTSHNSGHETKLHQCNLISFLMTYLKSDGQEIKEIQFEHNTG